MPSQALQVLPLLLLAQAIVLVVRMLPAARSRLGDLRAAALAGALLWPVVTWLLLAAAAAARVDPTI